MPNAASEFELTTERQRLFDSALDEGGRCTRFFVGCRAESEFGVEINIPGLHADDEWVGQPPNSYVEYEIKSLHRVNGITDVFARAVGGNALIDFGVALRVTS